MAIKNETLGKRGKYTLSWTYRGLSEQEVEDALERHPDIQKRMVEIGDEIGALLAGLVSRESGDAETSEESSRVTSKATEALESRSGDVDVV